MRMSLLRVLSLLLVSLLVAAPGRVSHRAANVFKHPAVLLILQPPCWMGPAPEILFGTDCRLDGIVVRYSWIQI